MDTQKPKVLIVCCGSMAKNQTSVKKVKQMLFKNDFFSFASTLVELVCDTRMTLLQHVSDNSNNGFKRFFFLWSNIPYTFFY